MRPARADHCLAVGQKCTFNEECCSKNCYAFKRGKICGCPIPTATDTIPAGERQIVKCTGRSQQTCQCVCPATAPELCPATNGCFPACTGGQIFNPATCKCECPPEAPQLCGGKCIAACGTGQVCCPTSQMCVAGCTAEQTLAGKVFNPVTCQCECPTGTGACGFQGRICCPTGTTCCGATGNNPVCCPSGQSCCVSGTGPDRTNYCCGPGFRCAGMTLPPVCVPTGTG